MNFIASTKKKSKKKKYALLFPFTVIFIAGVALGWIKFAWPLLKIRESESWIKIPCKVITSKVKVTKSRDSQKRSTTKFDFYIVYEYEFKGIKYFSSSYDFNFPYGSRGNCKSDVLVASYPPGKTTFCYVNPINPEKAIISKKFINSWGLNILSLILIYLGLGGVVKLLMPKRNCHTVEERNCTLAQRAEESKRNHTRTKSN